LERRILKKLGRDHSSTPRRKPTLDASAILALQAGIPQI
jgi:hypothetical protein